MKIAFIVNEFPSLSQTFVLNQITGLLDRGHDVDIFAETVRSGLKIHDDVKRYNLLGRTSYFLAIPHDRVFRTVQGLRYISKFVTKYPLPLLRSLNIFKYGRKAASLELLYLIIPFLEKGPYDVIHCQLGMCGPKALLLKQIAGVNAKLVTSFRGYDASSTLKNNPGFYDDLFRMGELFCPVSQYLRERIIKEGCNEKKIVVFRSGIDCEKFKYFPRTIADTEVIKVLTIARLVEKKGVRYAIEAIARLVGTGRRVNYVVVGDGELHADLERLIKHLEVTTHVQLLGWQTHDEVIKLLQNTHILVAPSVTAGNGDQEGIPNAIKEAMAMGLPVISTRHGGIAELLEEGVSGFLVPERDVDALADRLAYLIEHPKIRAEMGWAGRKHVEQHYDIEKLNDRLVELYEQVVRS